MSYEVTKSSEPIRVSKLSSELQRKFRALLDEADDLFNMRGDTEEMEAAAVLLHQHITEEVSANPILARAVSNKLEKRSLLESLCELDGGCQQSIQFLIEKNIHALLWLKRYPSSYSKHASIYQIASSGSNCALLHWIAERYPWVFQHQVCQQNPPHLDMMKTYANARCESTTVRQFYELYPQGLRERNKTIGWKYYPLSISLGGSGEPDAGLFIWMATQYPGAVYHHECQGYTMMHDVCSLLARTKCTPNMANICRFLISKHSGLIRKKRNRGRCLPIHLLANRCNRSLVQEIAILLLKAYPECVQVDASNLYPKLSSVPFIQQVHPLVVDEMDVDQQILQLNKISQHLVEAVIMPYCNTTNGSNGSADQSNLFGSLSEVFSSWAHLRVSDLSMRKQRIQVFITDTCRRLEGEDLPDIEEEEFGLAEFSQQPARRHYSNLSFRPRPHPGWLSFHPQAGWVLPL